MVSWVVLLIVRGALRGEPTPIPLGGVAHHRRLVTVKAARLTPTVSPLVRPPTVTTDVFLGTRIELTPVTEVPLTTDIWGARPPLVARAPAAIA